MSWRKKRGADGCVPNVQSRALAALTKSSATEDDVLARTCSRILKDAGRHDGPVLLKRIAKGLPRNFILEKLNTNKKTLEYSQRLPTNESLGGNYARNVTWEKVDLISALW